jgi:hypothetical protein
MAQLGGRVPAAPDQSLSSLPIIPSTSEDAELKKLLVEASVDTQRFDSAPNSVKHAVLDCLDPKRQHKPKWSTLPVEYGAIADLLLDTKLAPETRHEEYENLGQLRLKAGSDNLQSLLGRFHSHDIVDRQDRTAWDLALLEITDFLADEPRSGEDPTWKACCFIKLELEDQQEQPRLSAMESL